MLQKLWTIQHFTLEGNHERNALYILALQQVSIMLKSVTFTFTWYTVCAKVTQWIVTCLGYILH